MAWFFPQSRCFKSEMEFRIKVLYLFDCKSFRQDHGISKFSFSFNLVSLNLYFGKLYIIIKIIFILKFFNIYTALHGGYVCLL